MQLRILPMIQMKERKSVLETCVEPSYCGEITTFPLDLHLQYKQNVGACFRIIKEVDLKSRTKG